MERPFVIAQQIPLHDKNWFGTGGSAKYYCEPTTGEDFQHAFQYAKEHNLKTFFLGSGANILISDDGFDGLVIHPKNTGITIQPIDAKSSLVTAGSGCTVEQLITFCLENHLGGLEEFSGIPGTVGGAVYINLHYFQFLLSQFLVSATVIEKSTNQIITVDNNWFEFGYNQSKLLAGNHFLVDATFKVQNLTQSETDYALGRKYEIIRHRQARYPQKGTCGSFFRNFYPEEVTLEQNGKKIIFVAYYLDKIGIKGVLRSGNAQVSYQHANMIVNLGNATTADIIAVARTMQERVFESFGITPQPECRLVGFAQYPLIQNS